MEAFERICVIESNAAATVLAAQLEAQNIPHRIVTHRDSAFDGVYEDSLGWGRLEAPAAHREAIETILKALDISDNEESDDSPNEH